jgi:membrane protein DedA with SNARE-associated domain
MEGMLAWLSSLPTVALLAAMAALAAVENIFPPIPADAIVAFGGFLAARSGASPWPAFLAVWAGNMAGVVIMFFLGRRYGTTALERRYKLDRSGRADARILEWHDKYGTLAFFFSRFVPGVRAVVPPVAGALRIPFPGAMIAIAAASGLWYGALTWLAFHAGNNWEALLDTIQRLGMGTALGAALILLVVGGWWYLRRRRRREHPPAA